MNLKLPLPNNITDKYKLSNYEYSAPFDIEKNKYVDGYIVVDYQQIMIFINGKLKRKFSIKSFDHIYSKTTNFGGYIYGVKKSKETLICSCSNAHFYRLASISLGIDLFISEDFFAKSDEKERVCPKCKMPYLNDSSVCIYCSKKTGTIRKLLKYVLKYKIRLFFCYLLLLIPITISMINPLVYEKLVDDFIIQKVFNANFVFYVFLALCLYFVSTIVSIIRARMEPVISNNIVKDLRIDLYHKIQKLSVASASKKTTGGLISRLNNDTETIQNFLGGNLPSLIIQFITFIVSFTLMLIMDYKIALLMFIPLPFVYLITSKLGSRINSKYGLRWKYLSDANNTLHDILQGIKVVKTFSKEKFEINKFKNKNIMIKNIDIKTEKFWSTFMPIIWNIIAIGEVLFIFLIGSQILDQTIKLGAMIKWMSYSSMLYGSINAFVQVPRILFQFNVSAIKVLEILDEEIPEKADILCPELTGKIKIDNLRFGYLSYTPVLKNIFVEINPGETIGIVGHSGSGKTTLINLILKLYSPDNGRILMDEIDINGIDSTSYRKKIGVVLQETYLFNGTIYENIKYGKDSATMDEVIEVAKLARAHDFIVKKEFGYDTKLGQRGNGLSGGEKQRIAIARALLNKPSIFILDEATSSLDTVTEKEIQDAIKDITKNKTTLIIAHRLSTLKNADKIIVLDKGKMVEFGTHEELLSKKGHYYSLVNAQRLTYEKN